MSSMQQLILAIEASTASGSIALLSRHDAAAPWRLLASSLVSMGSGRDDALTPAVDALLRSQGVAPHHLTGVLCGSGPGSFTSLRIAASLAKGLAFALAIPLYAVSSLALVSSPDGAPPREGMYRVVMDALRGEYYVQRMAVSESGAVALHGAVDREAGTQLFGPSARDESSASTSTSVEQSSDGATDDRAGVLAVAADAPWCPSATAAVRTADLWFAAGPVSVDHWEPAYGRLAEAQVKWEAAHGRSLPTA